MRLNPNPHARVGPEWATEATIERRDYLAVKMGMDRMMLMRPESGNRDRPPRLVGQRHALRYAMRFAPGTQPSFPEIAAAMDEGWGHTQGSIGVVVEMLRCLAASGLIVIVDKQAFSGKPVGGVADLKPVLQGE